MAQFDMPLEQLREYRPTVQRPDDFEEFWVSSLDTARKAARGGAPILTPVETGLTAVTVDDVTFPGFAADPIKGWLIRPVGVAPEGGWPTIVQMIAYGGGRGLPHEHLKWAAAGYAHLVVDARGQGSHWGSGGDTGDPHGRSASVGGWLTSGIDDPHHHYYRRYYIDGVRAVDIARSIPGLNAERVAFLGISQAGGGVIAASSILSMVNEPVATVMTNVPFLCNFKRAVQIVDSRPYGEITQLLSVKRSPEFEKVVWNTLSYIDGVNFALYATSPVLFSVALMDFTCPPSTVFAAYNAWGDHAGVPVEKEITVYPYNNHEGGQEYHFGTELAWANAHV